MKRSGLKEIKKLVYILSIKFKKIDYRPEGVLFKTN